MSKITDYSFLFQSMFGTKSTSAIGSFQLSQLNSCSVQAQLKAAGIDTNSRQYKAAIKQMTSNANGTMYANIQGIKNLMKSYDKDGDYIDPTTGLAGLLVTEENANSRKLAKNPITGGICSSALRTGTSKSIQEPMSVSTPNTTRSAGIKIHVTAMTRSPAPNTFPPFFTGRFVSP